MTPVIVMSMIMTSTMSKTELAEMITVKSKFETWELSVSAYIVVHSKDVS